MQESTAFIHLGSIAKIRNALSKIVVAFITSILIHYYEVALKNLQLNLNSAVRVLGLQKIAVFLPY